MDQQIIQGFEQLQNLNKEFGMDNELAAGILKDLNRFRAIIPIIGRFGSEKNMLINVLLRGNNALLKEGTIFDSALPVEICYGGQNKATILGKNEHGIDLDAFLGGKADTYGADAVGLALDIPILKKMPEITIVDIPEFEPEFGTISRVVKEYLSRSLACILMFPADDMEPESGEISFIKAIKAAGVPLHIMISKIDSVPADSINNKIEELNLSLARHIHGMEITFCAPGTIPDQYSEFLDFLFKVQANIHTLSQKKYSAILIKQLELIQLYIKTRISNRSLSLLALDSRDVDMNSKIESMIETVKTTATEEEKLPEGLEEIKADAKKVIHSDESSFVKMLLNYREISEKTKSSMKVDLTEINAIINVELPTLLKKSGPDNSYELLSNFKAEYSKFKDFILYDKLIGKNVVGLGGCSGSGKTSFLNSLLGSSILPADKEPFKSLSTYVIEGDTYKVQGVNIFDAKIDMEGSLGSEICASPEEASELKRILNNIFVFTPRQKYKHIAFLDMPSYDTQFNKDLPANRDMDHCDRHQLNSSDFILWFIKGSQDTISDVDIKYLATIRKDIPKVFVITDAIQKSFKELNSMIYKVKMDLDMHGISHIGVYSYDAEKPFAYGSREITQQLEKWDDVKYEDMGFAKRFKALFVKCIEYYESEINSHNKQLNGLTKALGLSENNYVRDYLYNMSREMEFKKAEMTKSITEMKDLQSSFFKQIKAVSDVVGIAMPEPSAIDLITDSLKDPMEMLLECRKKLSIFRKFNYRSFITDFSSITPVFNQCPGGSEYKSALSITVENTCQIALSKIHFNDVYTQTEEYKKMIDSQEIGNWGEETELKNQPNNADAMRIYFKRLIGRKYPVPEHPLRLKDDYTKELYMKMLCVIMLYDNEPTEAQTMYIQRLLSGISVKEYVSEYIKKAMMADVDFAGEFVHLMNGTKLSHNFVVDSLILISLDGDAKKKQMEFISELCEMLSIKEPMMEYLSSLAVAILEQDSHKYQQTLGKLPPEIDNNMFFGYIKTFFSGCLINTPDEVYYYSKEKKAIPFMHDNLTIFGVKKIRLENLIIDLGEISPYFESFDTLQIVNCDFINGKKSIRLGDGTTMILENCNFKGFRGFKVPLIVLDAVMKEMIVENCDFVECSVDANWMEGLGAIFSLNGRLNRFSIQNSRFTKCVLRNVRNFHDSGALGYIRSEAVSIINNTFTACRCDTGRLFYISSGKIMEDNNRALGLPKMNYY